MSNSHRLQAVRQHLRRWLLETYAQDTSASQPMLQICAPPESEVAGRADVDQEATGAAETGPAVEDDAEDAQPANESNSDSDNSVDSEQSVEAAPKLDSEPGDDSEPNSPSSQAGQQAELSNDEVVAGADEPVDDHQAQAAAIDATIQSESILIREGFYAGRSFQLTTPEGTLHATWLMAPDELVISDPAGEVVASFTGPWEEQQDTTAATLPLHRPESDSSQADRDDDASSTKAA